jgi:hypothetical protein
MTKAPQEPEHRQARSDLGVLERDPRHPHQAEGGQAGGCKSPGHIQPGTDQKAELAALKAMAFKGDKAVEIAKANVDKAVKAVAAKSEKSTANEIAAVKAFRRLGIVAKPRVDTFTFNLWLAKGFRPIEGSKSVRVANLRLFHESQVSR